MHRGGRSREGAQEDAEYGAVEVEWFGHMVLEVRGGVPALPGEDDPQLCSRVPISVRDRW
ncbi:hypothetical protein BIV25_35260 [Streptomyces sp. MUSC 14]|nr:hypothetical protein BIV25_35260 [Streptomyces sp. MUSC 14]